MYTTSSRRSTIHNDMEGNGTLTLRYFRVGLGDLWWTRWSKVDTKMLQSLPRRPVMNKEVEGAGAVWSRDNRLFERQADHRPRWRGWHPCRWRRSTNVSCPPARRQSGRLMRVLEACRMDSAGWGGHHTEFSSDFRPEAAFEPVSRGGMVRPSLDAWYSAEE